MDKSLTTKFVLSILVTLLVLWLLYPFWIVIAWGVIFAVTFDPISVLLQKRCGFSALWANILITVLFCLIIVLPLLIFTGIGIVQLHNLLMQHSLTGWLHKAESEIYEVPLIGGWAKSLITQANPQAILQHANGGWVKKLLPLVQGIASSVTTVVISFVILIALIYNFLSGKKLLNRLVQKHLVSGFDNGQQLVDQVVIGIRAVSSSLLLNCVVTTLVMSLVYWICGLPVPFLLGLITGMISLIPFVLPIFYVLFGLLLFFGGEPHSVAISVFVVGIFLNLVMDNIVQPKVLGSKMHLSFVASLIGIMGGLALFGIAGVFLGPILLNLMFYYLMRGEA